MTKLEKAVVDSLNARTVLRLLYSTCCMRCDYEESDGELRNHCLDCARTFITMVHKRASAIEARLAQRRKKP